MSHQPQYFAQSSSDQTLAGDVQYNSLAKFYPFYLSQHTTSTCRRLHFAGTSLVIGTMAVAAMTRKPKLLLALPLMGYGFAWVGHFYFEQNKPATFKYPLYSLASDFLMYKDMLLGRVKW